MLGIDEPGEKKLVHEETMNKSVFHPCSSVAK